MYFLLFSKKGENGGQRSKTNYLLSHTLSVVCLCVLSVYVRSRYFSARCVFSRKSTVRENTKKHSINIMVFLVGGFQYTQKKEIILF